MPPAPGSSGDWWPADLRWPNSTGAQNGVRYAYFAQAQRLAIELNGQVKRGTYSSEYKEQFYKGLIGYFRSQNKNEGRAYYLYKEKFGVDPCWKKEPATPTMDVINYVRKSNIAFAKRRSA